MTTHEQSGVTFMETMVTIIIVAVLAAIAFPSYEYLVQNYRSRTISTDFNSALAFTRSEAVKQGSTVTICAASDPTGTACGNNTNWSNGWIIFSDPNNDGLIDNATDILRAQSTLAQNTTFTTNQARVTFNSRGFSANGAATFNIGAPGCSGMHGRQFTLSNTGRVTITQVAC